MLQHVPPSQRARNQHRPSSLQLLSVGQTPTYGKVEKGKNENSPFVTQFHSIFFVVHYMFFGNDYSAFHSLESLNYNTKRLQIKLTKIWNINKINKKRDQ